jgi:branched-chain amino acid transport system substrate-binding protein
MAGCWHSIQQANLPQKTVAHRSYRRETVDGQNNEPICTTSPELDGAPDRGHCLAYETERTVANTRTLIKDKNVFALLSFYGSSPTTEAMNKVFGPAKVPLVGTISGAGTLREPLAANANSRYMFHVRTSYADETAVIVNYLAGLGIARIAVFYQNDGFGKSGLEGVTTALGQHKLAPVAVGTVERNSIDVAKAVEAIAKANAQAVIMVTLYKPTAAFIMAMKQVG